MQILEGRIAIVTGGSKGIGKSIVEKFVKEGAIVVFTYNSSPQSAEDVLIALGEENVMAVKCNVTNTDEVTELIDETNAKFGTIDILVNNAGITKDTLIMRMSENDFESVIKTNLTSAFITIKAVMRTMMSKRSGRIINIASVVGLIGNPGQANYVASKAGLIGMSKSVAQEVASRNILVNCVAPGFIETDMTSKLSLSDDQRSALMGQIPLKKAGTTEDVANMVAFLASDNAKYITGQVFAVDGGMTMVG